MFLSHKNLREKKMKFYSRYRSLEANTLITNGVRIPTIFSQYALNLEAIFGDAKSVSEQ